MVQHLKITFMATKIDNQYVLPFLSILLIIGRRKAAVLPLPVSAQVITSFLPAISFIALNFLFKTFYIYTKMYSNSVYLFWTAVGVVYLALSMLF